MVPGLSRRASWYWLLIVAAAVILVVSAAADATRDLTLATSAAFFALACGLADRIQVRLSSSRPGGGVLFTTSCAVVVAIILLFSWSWSVLIAAIGIALGGILRGQRQPLKLVFNCANIALSVGAASAVWALGRGDVGLSSALAAPWVVLAAVTFFFANSGMAATMVAFVLDLPIDLIWQRGHGNMLMSNMALLAVGVPIAGLWLAYPWMLVCLVLALLALHRAMADRIKLETQTLDSLFSLADILDARDKYTHGHSERVGYYAEQLAVQCGLSGDRAHLTFLAGRLHDIGKCAINNEVLLKRSALNERERDHMRRHPEVGSAMLAHFSLFREVARFVRGHHERWDGKGYPDGLHGEAIPLEARIIAVVDAYDAMTTTRPYREALAHREAVRRLQAGAAKQWDPHVVATFVKWAEEHLVRGPNPAVITPAA